MTESTCFLGWYDPDRKRTVEQKITAACDRFREKFDVNANVCLCSLADQLAIAEKPDIPNVLIQARGYIARNTFYVGREGVSEPVEVPS